MKKIVTIIFITVLSMTVMAQVQPIDFDNAPTLNSNDVFIIQRVSDGKVYKLDWGDLEAQISPYELYYEDKPSFPIRSYTATGSNNIMIGNSHIMQGLLNNSIIAGGNNSSIDAGNYFSYIGTQGGSVTNGYNSQVIGGNGFDIDSMYYSALINSDIDAFYVDSCFIANSSIYLNQSFALSKHYLIGVDDYYRSSTFPGDVLKGFSAASEGITIRGENQAIFGEWNKISADGLFLVGNGTAFGSTNNAFEVKRDGTILSDAAFYAGDTANITTGLTAGMISNNDAGNLMQYDGSNWQTFNKSCGDFALGAYVPEDSTQRTATAVAGTYYFLGVEETNKFVNYENQGFTFEGDTVVFDSGGITTDTIRHSVYASIAASSDINNTTVTFIISVDDVVQPQTRATTKLTTSGDVYALSMTGFIDLPIDSKVKILIKSDKAGASITTEEFSIKLNRE